MLIMGSINGYANIFFFTWLQGRTPEALLGRVMSLIMFASVGVTPISQTLAGALVDINMYFLFVGSGICVFIVSLFALTNRGIRDMGYELDEINVRNAENEAVPNVVEV